MTVQGNVHNKTLPHVSDTISDSRPAPGLRNGPLEYRGRHTLEKSRIPPGSRLGTASADWRRVEGFDSVRQPTRGWFGVYDVVCVGFGPANIALAIALEELWPAAQAKFLEREPGPCWQPGMLLDGTDIQNDPIRDLVTPRNPRSRYTFINYLHEEGRLFRHLNLPGHFPLRKEYARYIQWVAEQVPVDVDYGQDVA